MSLLESILPPPRSVACIRDQTLPSYFGSLSVFHHCSSPVQPGSIFGKWPVKCTISLIIWVSSLLVIVNPTFKKLEEVALSFFLWNLENGTRFLAWQPYFLVFLSFVDDVDEGIGRWSNL